MGRLPRALAQALPASAESESRPLVLTVAVPDTSGHENDVVTLGNLQLENIPHFRPFAASLSAAGVSHKPISVRYIQGSQTVVLSHIECRLQDVAHLPLLQQLCIQYTPLTSLLLDLPWFGMDPLPELSALTLTRLTLRGGLPYVYQFLAALHAPALQHLEVKFHRSLWDHLGNPDDPSLDHAYTLALSPQRLPALRVARFEETEEVPRYSEVALGCALGPMLSLATLEDVEVRLRASAMWVSDADAAVVARAWPNLRRLVLRSVQVSRRLPTLDALVYLEAGCGNIEELFLPRLDLGLASTSNDDQGTQGQSQDDSDNVSFPRGMVQCEWGHPLRSLRVGCQTRKTVTQEQATVIGRRIDELFPNLEPDVQFMSAASAELYMSDWYLIWTGIIGAKVARLQQK
ncbi:hypothetical protein GSI_05196 [Ganoderma sinense ZZ0214-1]|uniref:F-box domain-containing protein n=1 Tax=Ganoderma sinense ZZ0214-1 TaxID=1077348 RepID=A0A2G8SFH0_9APHY|nr:hypothetical protein GSI_05196 [Ganoderma sinense ZZ0214-1]